jgi:TP901 family phage tail tape measure protein
MNIGQLIATLGVDASDLYTGQQELLKFQKTAEQSMAATSKSIEEMGKTVEKVGKNMSIYITAPLTLLAGSSAKLQSSYESSLSKVVGLVGQSAEQTKKWSNEMLQMSGSIGQGPLQLADALYFVTSAGIETEQVMNVVETSAKAATAGLGQTAVVADMLTSAINAYGVENLDAAQAADILTASVREGKMEADALAGSVGFVIPLAAEMGVEFDQVAAAMASMSLTGSNASESATMLKGIMAALLKPTQDAEDALNRMGTSSAQLRKTMREDGLMSALEDIRALTAKFGETVTVDVFPEIRALTGVLSLMGENFESNNEILKRVTASAGDLNKAFAVSADTAEFRYNTALNESKVAMIALGGAINTAMIPILQSISRTLTEVTKWFNSLSESQQHSIVVIGAVIAVLGPLAVGLGFLMTTVIPGLITIVSGLTSAFVALRLAMMANPILAVGLAVASLTAYYLYNTSSVNDNTDAVVKNAAGLKTMNDELDRTLALQGAQQGIGNKMPALGKMSGPQLDTFKAQIQNQISLTQDQTIAIEAEYQKRLTTDNDYLSAKRTFDTMMANKEYTLEAHKAARIMNERKDFFDKSRAVQLAVNAQTLTDLNKNLTTVDAAIKAFQKAHPDSVIPTIPKDIDTRIKEIMIAMQAASGKQLDNYANEVIALNQIKKAQEDLINQALYRAQINADGIENSVSMKPMQGKSSGPLAMPKNLFTLSGAYGAEVQPMTQTGLEPMKLLTEEQRKQLEYQAKLADNANTMASQNEMYSNIAEQTAKYGQQVNNLISSYGALVQSQKQKALDLIDKTAKAEHKSAEWVAKEKEKINAQYSKKFKAMAYAQAVINTAIAVTTALASAPPPFNLILAALSAAAGALEIATIQGTPMANGGVIPTGYPNDTYPAMLSSGETVVPPGKLPSLTGRSQTIQFKPVKLHVDGREIWGMLEEIEELNNSF